MIIVYCETCGRRIQDAEITEQRAHQVAANFPDGEEEGVEKHVGSQE